MNAKQLRNSILQMAIQGKLVPQDPNDEPASVLLDKIRQEKKRLVKEGVLKKKDLVETPISEDEKPFEIPDNWAWCRIGDIFNLVSGKQQSTNNKKIGSLQKYITTSNLYWNKFVLDSLKEMYFTDEELKNCSARKGDLLVCEGGAGYGRSAIWPYDYDICLQNHVHRLRPYVKGVCQYIYYLIYFLKESYRLLSVGTAMPGLSANRLKEIIVPLPPLAEQHRIVAKLEEILPLVDEYGKAQEEANKLQAELPDKLRKSILQEAIQGKLVLQDPNDEPASILLNKIRQEKKRLVKEGVLKKKDLVEITITDDEKPFEIPYSWEWCRIGDIFNHVSGKQQSTNNKKIGTLQKYITTSNLYWNRFVLDSLKEMYFTDEELKTCSASKGDLLVCEGGAGYGRSAIWPYDYDICLQNHVHRLRPYVKGVCQYIYYLIYFLKESYRLLSVGTAMPGLSANRLKEIIVPLPPLAEQHRIVTKIEELFNELKNNE